MVHMEHCFFGIAGHSGDFNRGVFLKTDRQSDNKRKRGRYDS